MMTVHLTQIYLDQDVSFPFSWRFQVYMCERLSALTPNSAAFASRYGPAYKLMFRVSAKADIDRVELRGPTVFRGDQDVEYTIFLPYNLIVQSTEPNRAALSAMITGIYTVYERLGIDATLLRAAEIETIAAVLSSPEMFE